MKTLYFVTKKQSTEIEALLQHVGTEEIPYLASPYKWIIEALEDSKAPLMTKAWAWLTRNTDKIMFIPSLDDLANAICYCGNEASNVMNNGECMSCHVGITDLELMMAGADHDGDAVGYVDTLEQR